MVSIRSFRYLWDNWLFSTIASFLPPLNFITVHYTYFFATCILFSLVLWGSSNPGMSVSFTDSLYLVVSAMTEAGLNNLNLSQLTTFQQVLLWLLMLLGSTIFVSISTVWTRKRVFESRFNHIVKLQKDARRLRGKSVSMSGGLDGASPENLVAEDQFKPELPASDNPSTPTAGDLEASRPAPYQPTRGGQASRGSLEDMLSPRTSVPTMHYAVSPAVKTKPGLSFVGIGAHPNATGFKATLSGGIYDRRNTTSREKTNEDELDHLQYPPYLTRRTTGRNAQFFDLSKAERDHLGGVEYRALSLLAWLVPAYFVLWQLVGSIGLAAYTARNRASIALDNGVHPWLVLPSSYLPQLISLGGWVSSTGFRPSTIMACHCLI